MKKRVMILALSIAAACLYGVELSGFIQNDMMQEQTKDLVWGGDVAIHINAPGADSLKLSKKTEIVFFACPAGNSIEWTLGKQMEEGDDWHYDIQHIAAQTRFLRKTVKDRNIVLVCLQNNAKAWTVYDDDHPADYLQLIQNMVSDVCGYFSDFDYTIALNGHSAGGSWVLRYLQGISQIPGMVTRVGFLDSNYNYKYDADHYDGLFRQFLNQRDSTYLCVIAYNDSAALLNGQHFISTGGTWCVSKLMKSRLEPYFTFTDSHDVDFYRYIALDKRFEILLKKNPTQAILHTVQVYRNGFIHSMLNGTEYEDLGYTYYGDPAYMDYIQGNPPPVPGGSALVPENGDSVNFSITPVAEATGYRLYLTSDGMTVTDTLYSESGSGKFAVPRGELVLARVSAVNRWGESELSGLYPVLCNSDTNRVLIANAYTKELYHDYMLHHAGAIQGSGIGACSIASCDMSRLLSGDPEMTDFPVIDLIVGREDRRSETLSDDEQSLVKTYLQNGGYLFISGMELGYDLYLKGTATDTAFYRDYLKAVCVDDKPFGESSLYYNFRMQYDDIIDLFHSDDGTHGTYKNSDPDELLALNGAGEFIWLEKDDGNTCCAGVAYSGMFPGGNTEGKLLYSSVPFETVYDTDEAALFMYSCLSYFLYPGVDRVATNIPAEYAVSAYPNPFNPAVSIAYDLPEAAELSLQIFNTRGQCVSSLEISRAAGKHHWMWHADGQPSGLYFLRFQARTARGENYRLCRKLILMK